MPRQLSHNRPDREGLPVESVLDALRNDQRRAVLRLLTASDGAMGVRKLADELAIGTSLPIHDSDRIAAELHHNHLPRLDSLGIITYDPAANVAESLETIEELTPFLEFLEVKRDE